MKDMILIGKSECAALLELFANCQSAFTDETATSLPAFEKFAAELYPTISNLLYKRSILAPLDKNFVGEHTSERLLDFQWQTPEPSSLAMVQAANKIQAQMSRQEVRLLYLLLEDLNQFFHQPGYYQTTKSIQEFYLKHSDRLVHSIAVLKAELSGDSEPIE